jgi:hypothetical protein
MPPPADEISYLRQIEALANEVVDCADDEGWLSYEPDPDDATPLQRTVNKIARTLRYVHYEGDGCIDE